MILNKTIRNAKKQYYSNQFDLYKNDAKKTWDILREIIHRNKKKTEFPTKFIKNE